MLTYAARRLAALVPTLFAVMVIVFVASRAMPGDPVATMLSDHSADVAMAARLRAEYGLDRPLHEQFVALFGWCAARRFRARRTAICTCAWRT